MTRHCVVYCEAINLDSFTLNGCRCNFPTIMMLISSPLHHANYKRKDMSLTKQLQLEWEETELFEKGISKKLFDHTISEGEAELLAGMLCLCQQYREILQNKLMMHF